MRTSVPFQNQIPVFHKLESIADMAALTPEERDFYHVSLDSYRTNMACLEHERNVGRAEGRLEGRAEGRLEGRAEGRAEGEAIGEARGVAQGVLQVARSLKAMHTMSDEQIAAATGLKVEQIALL